MRRQLIAVATGGCLSHLSLRGWCHQRCHRVLASRDSAMGAI
jgi:hypothetical protein